MTVTQLRAINEPHNPPINELVLGVNIDQPSFSPVNYGLFWNEIRVEFPKTSTRIPIISSGRHTWSDEEPLLPRTWYETENQQRLIQLQHDRFIFNWRQMKPSQSYPGFNVLLPEFEKHWNKYLKWSNSASTPLSVSGFEMTYMNHIDERFGWAGAEDNSKFFKFFPIGKLGGSINMIAAANSLRFKDATNAIDFTVSLKQGLKADENQTPVAVFELTAKTNSADKGLAWFKLAHLRLHELFVALTTEQAQKIWGFDSKVGNA